MESCLIMDRDWNTLQILMWWNIIKYIWCPRRKNQYSVMS
jgi:hypothetical protein